ncbi:hypothetical protein EP7_005574 (plasmid) [Isosphaeraceae bacterium EP7]
MMASGLAAASAQAARAADRIATSVIMGEVTTFLAGQPLPAPLLARLDRGIDRGSLTREGALQRILRTPQVQTGLVRRLTEDLLNREPTTAESRALVGGMQTRGADVPWALLQVMTRPEYFDAQGATNTGFVRAATMELLNRPASSDELARAVPALDRGAPARAGFLRTLIGGREFHLARTLDAFQQFAGTSGTPQQQASALEAFRGPLGYTRMFARVLGSAATSTGLVPTLAQNPGLSVKRVPGFLAGWTVPNLAAPYNVANQSDRKIDNGTVDYWAITLNQLDAVLLTIVPTDNQPDTGFAVRIWGPDGKEIGAAVAGAQFSYVAATTGTYTLGISTKDDGVYAFNPNGAQKTPSGPSARTFTAEFQTYPGANTDTVNLLLKYQNPAYTDNNWPVWTAAQSQAYQTLTTIASAGANANSPGLVNFTDFRQIGDITDPKIIGNWLTTTWNPFQVIMDDLNNPQIASISYQYVFNAYSPQDWTTIVDAFIHNPEIHDAYVSVDTRLARANDARSDIYNDYLLRFQAWSTSNEVFLGQDPTIIAQLMTTGLTDIPLPTPVNQNSWIERLLAGLVAVGASFAGAVGTPAAGLAVAAAGNLIVNSIDAWLDGDFGNPKPPPPPPSRLEILGAAIDMQNTALNAYKNTFDLLTNQGFLKSVFSNFGLLEAMGTIQFTSSANDQATAAAVVRQNYDRSIWEQLLPRAFSWKLIAPTDNGPNDTLPNFTFFIPSGEKVQWETPNSALPIADGSSGPTWSYYPTNSQYSFASPGGQAIADAKAQIVALQSETPQFSFPGYDFTPSYNSDNKDWFGPGAVSAPQELTGRLGRFYTISTNSHLSETLYRHTLYGVNGFYQSWYTWADLDGVTIHQWALETPDGKGGYQELSHDAAAALFGTGALVTASPDPVDYKGGGSYFDFKIPGQGLATRFEVFTQWGKDTPGFAPGSLQPAAILQGGNMHVGLNPFNGYSQDFDNSYVTTYKLTYGANRLRSVRRPSEVPGPGAVPTPPRRV